ncbi:hypothetical protein [Rudaeicoccus suwonensis]|uniref:Uncharacterized protein n=1 Tax=Rudaeicoccus suwonensis TaxID=657409 RepID=A0A561E3N4_9MICO|nr:hypothetical protein [Rudaeicoccus suwonensis]TWE10223.1 hypothetical protein BKA23_2577 [Rudaeicoccus suwonensis]
MLKKTVPTTLVVAVAAASAALATGSAARAAVPAHHTSVAQQAAAAAFIPAALRPASQFAARTHRAVVVNSQTTATSQLTALPNGQFKLDVSQGPVRVQRGGSWVSIDTTLSRGADGMIRPAATTDQVAFSGGGDGPTVILGSGSHTTSLRLPLTLPAPTLSGSSATYRNVYAGVDLVLTATASGYTETLVVHNAAAAANPHLAQLRISATTKGMTLTRGSDGGLSLTGGSQQFHASAPVMWDSASNPLAGPAPTATDPGGANVTGIPNALHSAASGSTLTLAPLKSALTGANVRYPVYIDPTFTAYQSDHLTTFANGTHYYDDSDEDLLVGDCTLKGCNGAGAARSFFDFNTQAFAAPGTVKVTGATIYADEIWSAIASPTPVTLESTGTFGSTTTWPGPSNLRTLETRSSNAGSSAHYPANVTFGNSNVVNVFARMANAHQTNINFGLVSPNESYIHGLKRFSNVGSDLTAEVYFDYAPTLVAGSVNLGNDEVACPGKPIYSDTTTPTFAASATDNNPSGNSEPLGINFQLYQGDSTNPAPELFDQTQTPIMAQGVTNALATWDASTTDATNPEPMTAGAWEVRAQAISLDTDSAQETSQWSSYLKFVVDPTAPAMPTITQNPNGSYALSSSGAVAFVWSLASGEEPIPSSTTCDYNFTGSISGGIAADSSGNATLTLPAADSGPGLSLYVYAISAAHVPSSEANNDSTEAQRSVPHFER